jgi:Holliday junction resolvase-like predicted endonuclease
VADERGCTGRRVTPIELEADTEWHSESRVQAMVVSHLAGNGWQIRSVADTSTKAHGIDIVATKEAVRMGVEVKGFPSKKYAGPARSHEIKPTQPSAQP